MKYIILMLILTACASSIETPASISQINAEINKHSYNSSYICKNYVSDKYNALVKNGYPSSSMKVVYGYTDKFEEHVQLKVCDNSQCYYLDNRVNDIKSSTDLIRTQEFSPDSQEWQYIMRGAYY